MRWDSGPQGTEEDNQEQAMHVAIPAHGRHAFSMPPSRWAMGRSRGNGPTSAGIKYGQQGLTRFTKCARWQ